MVAASATAILTDIDLSSFPCAPEGPSNPAKYRPAGLANVLAHAFLTACINQAVSKRGRRRVRQGEEKEMLQIK